MSTVVKLEDAPSGGKDGGPSKALFVGGLLAVLLVGGVATWYFLHRRGKSPPSPDNPGDLKDWTSRSGYVGSLEPTVCAVGKEGLLCTVPDKNAYGVCRRLPGTNDVACVQPAPSEAPTGRDCATSCHASQGWRALYHPKDARPQGTGLTFDSNICLCYTQPATQWDRCVLDKDDRGWTLWSTPQHQQDCNVDSVIASPGFAMGVVGATPQEAVATPDLRACQAEVAGRLADDPLAYAVFDGDSKTCNVKTDDPSKNPFPACVYQNATNKYVVSTKTADELGGMQSCPSVQAIPYYGQLPDYYLNMVQPSLAGVQNPSAVDCSKACSQMDNTWGYPAFARPAFTWEDSKCSCYDFPSAPNEQLGKSAADVWRCAWSDPQKPKPDAKVLYVRNLDTDPLSPYHENSALPKELENCNHDGSKALFKRGQNDDCSQAGKQTVEVCNQIWDGTDTGHYYCAYSDSNWVPNTGNGMDCTNWYTQEPDMCVDNAVAGCKVKEIAQQPQTTIARCKSYSGIKGSICGDGPTGGCKDGLQCKDWTDAKGNVMDCKVCQ